MDLGPGNERLNLMPSYVTGLVVIDFMPDILEAFFRDLSNMEVLLAHIGMECFKVLHHVLFVKFPNLFFVNLSEDVFYLSVMLFLFLFDFFLLSLAIFINEIVKFNHFFIGSYDLRVRRLEQVLDTIRDCRFNFKVWLNGGSC